MSKFLTVKLIGTLPGIEHAAVIQNVADTVG